MYKNSIHKAAVLNSDTTRGALQPSCLDSNPTSTSRGTKNQLWNSSKVPYLNNRPKH